MNRLLKLLLALVLLACAPVWAQTDEVYCGVWENDPDCSSPSEEKNVVIGDTLPGCLCGSAVVASGGPTLNACDFPVDLTARCVVGGVIGYKKVSGNIGLREDLWVEWGPIQCAPGHVGQLGKWKDADVFQYTYGSIFGADGDRVYVRKTHTRSIVFGNSCTG